MKKLFVFLILVTNCVFAQFDEPSDESSGESYSLESLYKHDNSDLYGDPLRRMDEEDDSFFQEMESIYTEKKPIKIVPKKSEAPPPKASK